MLTEIIKRTKKKRKKCEKNNENNETKDLARWQQNSRSLVHYSIPIRVCKYVPSC